MKRLILMLSTAVCLLSSCQNYLDLKPKNQTVVGTLEDVKLMMSSYLFSLTSSDGYPIYFNGVAMHFPYNRDAIASFTMYSDDLDMRRAIENSYGRKYEKEYYESTDWKSSIFSETIWNNFYLHIGYMNSVMKSLGELLGSYEQSDFEKIKGEALTIRAFYIFKLLQLFAPYDNNELGIPLNLVVYVWKNQRWNVYLSGGFMMEKGLQAVYSGYIAGNGTTISKSKKEDIHGMQWSVNASVGAAYRFYGDWSLYFEPRFSHYFDCDQPASIRTDKPLGFGLSAGIRYAF